MNESVDIRDLPDHLISQGLYVASSDVLLDLTGLGRNALAQGLRRLRRQGKQFSPAKGLYVFVPAEYRSWGVVPASWFIDELMRHLNRSYYVSLLSAAAIHGASHQAPQVFQVVTDKTLPDRDLERVRLRFHQSRWIGQTPVKEHNTQTGTMRVATREATVVDLVERPRAAGGLSNIATILVEIGDLDGAELARLSGLRPRSHARRLGWLLDRFHRGRCDLAALRATAAPGEGAPALLSARGGKRGSVDSAWGVHINSEVEPDL